MPDATSTTEQQREGPVARTIEQQTAKVPSDVFLWAALGSMGLSALLQGGGKKNTSLFVGQWVPVFLMFGLYNKIVKVHGSDRFDHEGPPFLGNRQQGQQHGQGQHGPGQPSGQGQQFQTRPPQQQPQPQPAR
jgi:hypothetical protein